MTALTQFSLPFSQDFTIHGEFEGNEKSGKVIIFAHGFGVKRDSWGMFNDLGDVLKTDSMVIRFDFNQIDSQANATHVSPCSVQAQILQHIINYADQTFSPSHKTIIAHSMGCVMVGMLQPINFEKILLLSPPMTPPYQRVKDKFAQRPRSHFSENEQSILERSDGSWTYIPPEFWPEMKSVLPFELYKKLMLVTQLYAIRPLQDQVIINEDYEPLRLLLRNDYVEIDGGHDFAAPHRQKLLDTILQITRES